MTATKTFSAYQFEFTEGSSDTISVKEIESVGPMQGPPPPDVEYGTSITFARNLAKWAGTWNAMAEYLDDTGLNQAWTNGATYVNTSLTRTDVTADQIKAVFKTMLKTDFKSCVIDGDTMKIYAALDAAGSPSDTITYTYKGTIGEGDEVWHSFEGNKAGNYKYLIALAVEPGSATAAEHFHFRYGASSFDALTSDDMAMWMATVMKKDTAIPVLAASLETVIEELPWQYIITP